MDKVLVRKAMEAAWAWDDLLAAPIVGAPAANWRTIALLQMNASDSPGRDKQLEDDEADCVRRARGGDSKAFDTLIARYAPRLYTHIYRMVGQREEAEDLVQETFLRAYRYFASYDRARPFRTWIYAIATNTALNAIRARKRGGTAVSLDDEDREGASPERAAIGPDARESAAIGDLNAQLAAAVRRLPALPAALVHMHYFEGMAIREAAEACGMTEATAKVALHRARKRLREWLVKEKS